jgi:hypothetical protein
MWSDLRLPAVLPGSKAPPSMPVLEAANRPERALAQVLHAATESAVM